MNLGRTKLQSFNVAAYGTLRVLQPRLLHPPLLSRRCVKSKRISTNTFLATTESAFGSSQSHYSSDSTRGDHLQSTTMFSNLSTEVNWQILVYLWKHDLKSIRLISRFLCQQASVLPFTRIYISSHLEDLITLSEIACNQTLGPLVREIVYTGVYFRKGRLQDLGAIGRCLCHLTLPKIPAAVYSFTLLTSKSKITPLSLGKTSQH